MKYQYAIYGVGGLAVVIAAAALIKKKVPMGSMRIGPRSLPGAPGLYLQKPGDKPMVIAARFGTTAAKLAAANPGRNLYLVTTTPIKLPAGLADLGPRTGAQGTIK